MACNCMTNAEEEGKMQDDNRNGIPDVLEDSEPFTLTERRRWLFSVCPLLYDLYADRAEAGAQNRTADYD